MKGYIECLTKKNGYAFTMHSGTMEEVIDWLVEESVHKGEIIKAVIADDRKKGLNLMDGLRIE